MVFYVVVLRYIKCFYVADISRNSFSTVLGPTLSTKTELRRTYAPIGRRKREAEK